MFLVSEELSTKISRDNIKCGFEPINIEECRMSSQNLWIGVWVLIGALGDDSLEKNKVLCPIAFNEYFIKILL